MTVGQEWGTKSRRNRTGFRLWPFIRYYLDLLIDCIFGFFYNGKKKQVQNCSNPIIFESSISLAKKIRTRQLKSEDVVQAFIDRIKEVNPILNAVVDECFEKALEEARKIDNDIQVGNILEVDFQEKPFLGVPFTTKESTAVKGLSYTFGLVNREGTKASFDADYVALMRKAGGICLGVTNIPQLNLWVESVNPVYGRTNNPYDTTRNVGGSSGGEACILAAGGTPISIGTDIGGSCRIPAFMCGVYGHKPTSHLIPTKGMTFRTGQEKETMVVAGPITRFADEIAPMLKVLIPKNIDNLRLDEPVNLKDVKIYYIIDPRDPFVSPFRSEMTSTLTSAVKHFAEISKTPPEEVEFEGTKYAGKLWKYWMSQEVDKFKWDVTNREEEAQPLKEMFKYVIGDRRYTLSTLFNFANSMLPTPKADWARKETAKLKNDLLHKLGVDGVLLYPSAPWPASYHNSGFLRPWNFNLWAIWNVLQIPATQVPMGLRGGLPVGIQVVSAHNNDRLCIAVAKELERVFGGHVPPFQKV